MALPVLPLHLDPSRPPSGLGSPQEGGKGWGQGLAYPAATPKPLTLHLGRASGLLKWGWGVFSQYYFPPPAQGSGLLPVLPHLPALVPGPACIPQAPLHPAQP